MKLGNELDLTLLPPDELQKQSTGKKILNMYLYYVEESIITKNQEFLDDPISKKLKFPPLSLNLYYLMTPLMVEGDYHNRPLVEQSMLGKAMRILHENATIPAANLKGSLKTATEQVKITLNPIKIEEITKIWNAITNPFRLSVPYVVSVVQISDTTLPEVPSTKPVEKAEAEISALSEALTVFKIIPTLGKEKTPVVLLGTGFDKDNSKLFIKNKEVDKKDFSVTNSNQINLTIPIGIAPGLIEIKVVINGKESNSQFFTVQ